MIFSNLGSRDDLYSTAEFSAIALVGRAVNQTEEQWDAVRFIPKVDVQATVLEAAVGRISGDPNVQLGIYTNNETFQIPDTVLPGGQGNATDIPDLGQCCKLIKVTLPEPGVTLTAGTIYWLVANADQVNGVSFNGAWQVSHSGEFGAFAPGILPWILGFSQWPAARISGTRLQTLGPLSAEKQKRSLVQANAAGGRVRIFSNLDPLLPAPYLPGAGLFIAGDNVLGLPEAWRALPFTPRANVQAKTFSAAIGHTSGTNQINLGVYSDAGGVPGSPLPGAQGTITDLPESGDCCDFAILRLPGQGIALTGGTKYWLVASPNNVTAPDFFGLWQFSSNNIWSRLLPKSESWTDFSGFWMAAKITGQSE